MVDLTDFKTYYYPDGHRHIVSDKDLHGDTTLSVTLKTFDDLFLIAQVLCIHPEIKHLRIKYMLAARCDRRFSPGEALDLGIVCSAISRLVENAQLDVVSVVKPHSPITLQILKELGVENAYEEDYTPDLLRLMQQDVEKPCFIAPDEGARNWVSKHLRNEHILIGSKKRNKGGSISIEFKPNIIYKKDINSLADKTREYNNFVIIDDLCDGGGTFISIAQMIKSISPQAKVYLIVTHVIFSKGFQPFEGWIEKIYCTNSFADFENPLVKQIKI